MKRLEKEDTPPAVRYAERRRLRGWQIYLDLGSVRDPADLAKLPESEQKAWQQFWANVDTLLKWEQSTPR